MSGDVCDVREQIKTRWLCTRLKGDHFLWSYVCVCICMIVVSRDVFDYSMCVFSSQGWVVVNTGPQRTRWSSWPQLDDGVETPAGATQKCFPSFFCFLFFYLSSPYRSMWLKLSSWLIESTQHWIWFFLYIPVTEIHEQQEDDVFHNCLYQWRIQMMEL